MRRNAEIKIRVEYKKEKAKSETSRRFVDVLTHEVGTSLTTIDGQAFRLKKILANSGTDDAILRADKIRQAAKHIENVLRQVQVASEIEHGPIDVQWSSVNLRDIIADAVVELSDNHVINVDTAKLPISIQGNADMLQQIIENLLSNAVKYSPAGTPVSIWGRVEDNMAVVTVSDRGRGIPPNEQTQLLEPYFRASNSRGVHGTGIGLYVVGQYIHSHGGWIDIASEVGSGTAVTFQIPIIQPSEPSL
jgi:signal transduction histidine kinase